ncbi:NAD(P)-binding protein [Atractiella rhizophila]|nr:NAD(P)-binding protein [Atractiella rhizophila]
MRTVQFLVCKGAKVYLAARSEYRVSEAIKQLKEEGINDGTLHFLQLDLADPKSAKYSAEKFMQIENRLDILVNNAAKGPESGSYQLDSNGLLDVMVINHLGPYAFTEALLPLLKSTAAKPDSDVRIVYVSSAAHTFPTIGSFKGRQYLNKEFGDSFMGRLTTYGNSKLPNILHCNDLQRRLDQENVPITCLSVHPGTVDTPAQRHFFVGSMPSIMQPIGKLILPTFTVTSEQGAMTSAFAAAGTKVGLDRDAYKGVYLTPFGKIDTPSKHATNQRTIDELRETTEQVLRELDAL